MKGQHHHPETKTQRSTMPGFLFLATGVILALVLLDLPALLQVPLPAPSFSPPPAHAQVRTLRVGIYQNNPKVFVDDFGTPKGIFVDIINEIARREDWKIDYVFGTWAENIRRLEGNEIDMLVDVSYSQERAERFTFNRIFVLESWLEVYSRREAHIGSIPDLQSKKIAVLEGSVQDKYLRDEIRTAFPIEFTVQSYPDYESSARAVQSGEVDAMVASRFFFFSPLRYRDIVPTHIIFRPENLYLAFPRDGAKDVVETIDRHLVSMKNDTDSVYFQSLNHWLDIKPQPLIPRSIIAALALITGLLVLIGLFALLLRRQVDVKTRELTLINERLKAMNTELDLLVTKERQAEKELQKAHDELELRIRERTAELVSANERLRELDRLKSQFLATMSHELRTPLNSIIGFTGILRQGFAGPVNDEQKKQLDMAYTSAKHLLSLINDLLDLSRIEAGKVELEHKGFNFADVVTEVVNGLMPMTNQKGISLHAELPGPGISMTGDRKRCYQVLLNLANNAVKFTEQGEIRIDAGAEDGKLRVCVADTGIGIKPENLPMLFEAFRQVDGSAKRVYEGTGLGLYLCRTLLTLMGGEIEVESEFGRGSRFTFTVPLILQEVRHEG
ncbi:MAG TPA: ATP-binding protein [Deltaproteobacteria bacterium]|nr:ATP-binding protein [Deltaproteobacteria bacterium]HPR54319.1 ATP-binding protein [Deltaproteobacteria bacterium]HXK47620.1 ATP-binding protein [Deltaproteobacteria bacterium]